MIERTTVLTPKEVESLSVQTLRVLKNVYSMRVSNTLNTIADIVISLNSSRVNDYYEELEAAYYAELEAEITELVEQEIRESEVASMEAWLADELDEYNNAFVDYP